MLFKKFLLLAIFGIGMAHAEGVVVVYLRKVLGVPEALSGEESYRDFKMPARYLFVERTREIATIVMLLALAFLVGEGPLERIVVFIWTFAFWDLFYYLSLYLLIKWPPKLTTLDVLFLIPRPWIAPVWIPIALSSTAILIILSFLL